MKRGLVGGATWSRVLVRAAARPERGRRVRAPRYSCAMSFGRNQHVAKAEAAEQKALNAKDATAYELAWREAGRLWERAAERETDPKRKQQYAGNADRARASADQPQATSDAETAAPPDPAEDELAGATARPHAN